MLIDTVVGAAHAKLRNKRVRPDSDSVRTADVVAPKRRYTPSGGGWEKIVVLGASTGGPELIGWILQQLTLECPGLVIVQHMPEAFTGAYARRLNTTCRIEVKEAEEGDRATRGRALIAPGNRHLVLRHGSGFHMASVVDGPLVNRHRPSVDVLFRSAAQSAGPNALGILLTGMGNDGAQGLLEMKKAGSVTLAQNEATSVVFGMPKEAITLGAVEKVVSPSEIVAAISAWSNAHTVRGQR
jgi:two-component system chemotaxis response regulator CheB